MTMTSIKQGVRDVRRDGRSHLFSVGQIVRLKSGFRMAVPKAGERYRVTATLPPRDNSPQYRIRNDDERHERVVTQDNLEPIDVLPETDDATLLERTFRNGKGTEAQHQGDTKAEAGEGSAEGR